MNKALFRMFMIFLLIFTVSPFIMAKQYHVPLLAVQEAVDAEGGIHHLGNVAHLYLDIEAGTGRVFLDTYPLTKADTQMSTRLAQKYACSLIEDECNTIDFFYTIRADSSIIGGPSASAAAAIVTVAALEDLDIVEGVSITGTITSGNIIGSVGGVKEKIGAAPDFNITKVLIPKGARNFTEEVEDINGSINVSTSLVDYGKTIGVEVVEVGTLEEALEHFTGKSFVNNDYSLKVSQEYTETMRGLSDILCNRSEMLGSAVEKLESEMTAKDYLIGKMNWSSRNATLELLSKSENASGNYQYYTSASYCFGANVQYSQRAFDLINLSESEKLGNLTRLQEMSEDLREQLEDKELRTITDLQTFMVVNERLLEAEDTLFKEGALFNVSKVSSNELAYAQERLFSALAWSHFFGSSGEEFVFDEESLRESCIESINEADEVFQYINLFVPMPDGFAKEDYAKAKEYYEDGEYALCLFKATKAKAQSNVFLSLIGTEESEVVSFIDLKLDVADDLIEKQRQKGRFPIVGYSYYEYSHALKEDNLFTSMLYAEYGLELSNLDIYFKAKPEGFASSFFKTLRVYFSGTNGYIFLGGFLVGIGFVLLVLLLIGLFVNPEGSSKAKASYRKKRFRKLREI